MKTTHKISITTGTVSGVTLGVISIGAMFGWNLTDKVALVSSVIALLINLIFGVLTTTKLPAKTEKIVKEVEAVAETVEAGINEAVVQTPAEATQPVSVPESEGGTQ